MFKLWQVRLKKFAVHMMVLLRHLAKEIHERRLISSIRLPFLLWQFSLTEAKESFLKRSFPEPSPHLAYASKEELHAGMEKILEEHGKKTLIIEHVEDLPEESLENHLSAAWMSADIQPNKFRFNVPLVYWYENALLAGQFSIVLQ
jgi:hypothetical protein